MIKFDKARAAQAVWAKAMQENAEAFQSVQVTQAAIMTQNRKAMEAYNKALLQTFVEEPDAKKAS